MLPNSSVQRGHKTSIQEATSKKPTNISVAHCVLGAVLGVSTQVIGLLFLTQNPEERYIMNHHL